MRIVFCFCWCIYFLRASFFFTPPPTDFLVGTAGGRSFPHVSLLQGGGGGGVRREHEIGGIKAGSSPFDTVRDIGEHLIQW